MGNSLWMSVRTAGQSPARNRPPSAQAISVLRAPAADPARWCYGYDLASEVHLKSGSLYPMLVRLADRGLLETSWEPSQGSRPPRHLYLWIWWLR
jgi:PadR family transcriptional regulator PadR